MAVKWVNLPFVSLFLNLFWSVSVVHADELVINGVALYEELGEPYYYGALSVKTPSSDSQNHLVNEAHRRMELRIVAKKISPRRFSKFWNESIATNNKETVLALFQKHIQRFLMIMKDDVIEGDRLVIEAFGSQRPVLISLNGVDLLEVTDQDFFNVLLRCWIGNVPVTRQFREDILGLDSKRLEVLLSRFRGLHTQPGRNEHVRKWNINPSSEDMSQYSKNNNNSVNPDPKISPLESFEVEKNQRTQLGSDIANESEYYYAAVDWASRHSQYPNKALEKGLEGVVRIRVTVDRQGRVLKAKLLQKSEHDILNQAALKAITKAAPFPQVPDSVSGESYLFTVPFKYQFDR